MNSQQIKTNNDSGSTTNSLTPPVNILENKPDYIPIPNQLPLKSLSHSKISTYSHLLKLI